MLKIKSIFLVALLLVLGSVDAMEPKGLENIGNSCFMNAAFQCLYNLPDLTAWLLSQPDDFYKPGTLASFFVDFVKTLGTTTHKTINPLPLCMKGWEALRLEPESAQDAAELVDVILSHLTDDDISDEKWESLPIYPGTRVPKTFLSELVTSVVDSRILPQEREEVCPPTTITEAYRVFRLPIQPTFTTLKDCFDDYFQPTALVGEGQYKCPAGPVDALKLVKLRDVAEYLMLGINRGVQQKGEQGVTLVKSLQPVSFPLADFNLAPYFGDNLVPKQTKYELVSFIVHIGSAAGGHYNAYVQKDGQWYFCDDEFVIPISNAQIKTIAQRGYGLDPAYVSGQKAEEDVPAGKEQTPVLFFYRKYL
jgi:ubiquitin C-terminal hydrolase